MTTTFVVTTIPTTVVVNDVQVRPAVQPAQPVEVVQSRATTVVLDNSTREQIISGQQGLPGPAGPAGEEGEPGGVVSVNGEAGVVLLDAADVGADAAGSAVASMSLHLADPDPHTQYIDDDDVIDGGNF